MTEEHFHCPKCGKAMPFIGKIRNIDELYFCNEDNIFLSVWKNKETLETYNTNWFIPEYITINQFNK